MDAKCFPLKHEGKVNC